MATETMVDECPRGNQTTTKGKNPEAIIDADAMQLKLLSHKAFMLYERKRELAKEYKRRYAIETSAINDELKRLNLQCEILRPNPKCFGTADCCELPGCEECRKVHLCHKAAKAGGVL